MPTPSFLGRIVRPFTEATSLPKMSVGLSAGTITGSVTNVPSGAFRAIFAAGCFWGVEHMFRQHFSSKGLHDARVGYVGGATSFPTYRSVCSGTTGHAEAVLLVYETAKISYASLVEFFYRMHDPTTPNTQGPDRGSQYRSAIFYINPEQEKVAKDVTKRVNEQWYNGKVVTEIAPAGQWWDAEEYHQLYLEKNPSGYECPSHYMRSFVDLK